ncbi:MAG TPA: hypothetical protein VFB72_13770, partial [Verrucomicrobiae bacterium]|nr:hypothetical protein [Verrucomicrobiae bacterium]
PAVARRRLEKLISCGLTEANFSTGDQHGAYVKPEYVLNGLLAACELGLTTVVTIELFQESVFPVDDFISHPDVERYIEKGRLAIKLAPWMKFKGKSPLSFTKKYLEFVDQARKPETGGCQTALKVISISPRQQLFACCGLPVEEIEELHLGSLLNASIKEVLSRAPDDFIKIWVHLYGPDAVIRYARQFDPSIPFPDQAAHICDACRAMYHNKRIREVVMQHPPPNVKDVMDFYFQTMLLPPQELKRSQTSAAFSHFGEPVSVLRQTHAMATSHCCAK